MVVECVQVRGHDGRGDGHGVSSPKWTLNSVRSYRGVPVTTASLGDGSLVPAGRCLVPDMVRSAGTSSREQVPVHDRAEHPVHPGAGGEWQVAAVPGLETG